MSELIIGGLEFSDEIDKDGEIEITQRFGVDSIYVNAAQAEEIMDHLSKVFDLESLTAGRVEELEQALKAIKKHQGLGGGKMGNTWHIASKALKGAV
jgi:hypothetical protein